MKLIICLNIRIKQIVSFNNFEQVYLVNFLPLGKLQLS